MNEDENIEETEGILEPEEDKASPMAEQVMAFLQSQTKEEDEKNEEERDEETARELFGEDAEEEPKEKRVEVEPDHAFEENYEPVYNVTVKTENIPVTEEDQRRYLKSMLNDVPLELDIPLYGGRLIIHARALSVYETQLAGVATYKKVSQTGSVGVTAIMAPTYLQKLRVALQLRTCNGRLISDLSYVPEPGMFEEHAKDLCEKAEKLVGGTNAARWNAYIYALNIFEHKLAKLNEMALNRDFLSPGE